MKFPPVIIGDESQAALDILRAIVMKNMSFASYAKAEARKIQTLVERLEEMSSVTAPLPAGYELSELKQCSLANAENIELRNMVLELTLHNILRFLQAEELYDLQPLMPQAVRKITAKGHGLVSCQEDAFFGGISCLDTFCVLPSKDELACEFKYHTATTTQQLDFEAVAKGLRLDLFAPASLTGNSGKKLIPNIVVATGYGVATKGYQDVKTVVRGLGWFALTLWDFGKRNKDKFRLVILGNKEADINHDSGIVE